MNLWRNQIRTEPIGLEWHVHCPNCKRHLSSAICKCVDQADYAAKLAQFSQIWPYLCAECEKIPEVKAQFDKVVKETEELLNERARRKGQL